MESYYKVLRKKLGREVLLLPGASIILAQADGKILLQKRDDGDWGLPGGLMELGESFQETCIREVKEETNLTVLEKDLQLLDTYSGEKYFVEAPNGDPYYAVTALYFSNQFEGELIPDGKETLELEFFGLDDLPGRVRVSHRHFLDQFAKRKLQ